MKAIAIFFAALLLTVSAPASVSDSVSVETIEKMEQSIVPILCMRVDDKNQIQTRVTLGTGFFINRNGDVLTAAHVVTELQRLTSLENPCFGAIYVAKTEWKNRYRNVDTDLQWFRMAECEYRENVDMGVCKAHLNPFLDPTTNKFIRPVSLASYVRYNDGSPIAFTGFPLQFAYPITSKGYIASYDPTAKKLIIDKTAWPGASGSPLYTSDGKVIGIVVEQGTDKSAGLAFARPTDLAFDLLREQKITVEK